MSPAAVIFKVSNSKTLSGETDFAFLINVCNQYLNFYASSDLSFLLLLLLLLLLFFMSCSLAHNRVSWNVLSVIGLVNFVEVAPVTVVTL